MRSKIISEFALLCIFSLNVLSFPSSDNPIMVTPETEVDLSTTTCSFPILSATCRQWADIHTKLLHIPKECSSNVWSKAVLTFVGEEKGLQYDRFGAVWIGDVEVIRTTTPEPTSDGITWNFDTDVTVYGEYIRNTKDISTYLSIPNNVGKTYTGIISVNLTLTVSLTTEKQLLSNFQYPPVVFPLTSAPRVAPTFPWDVMSITGNSTKNYQIIFPRGSVTNLVLDLYAHQSGCEEFYYTNVLNEYSSELGYCGGGVYRELQVHIDGYLAGSVYPFPTIFSGGINPFLWRPIAGIQSFSISPRRLDITPFLHLLQDDEKHNITLSVYSQNADSGSWYVDASLLIYDNKNGINEENAISSELTIYDSKPQIDVTVIDTEENITFETIGYHNYEISRILTYSNGSTRTITVDGKLVLFNSNAVIGSTTGLTVQRTLSQITSKIQESNGLTSYLTTVDDFSLSCFDYYYEGSTFTDLYAEVNYTYSRKKIFSSSTLINSLETQSINKNLITIDPVKNIKWKPYHTNIFKENQLGIISISWNDTITAVANYTKTSPKYFESGSSIELFTVSSGNDNPCYNSYTTANNGFVTLADLRTNDCSKQLGLNLCGYEICENIDLSSYNNVDPKDHIPNNINNFDLFTTIDMSSDFISIKEQIYNLPQIRSTKNIATKAKGIINDGTLSNVMSTLNPSEIFIRRNSRTAYKKNFEINQFLFNNNEMIIESTNANSIYNALPNTSILIGLFIISIFIMLSYIILIRKYNKSDRLYYQSIQEL